VTHVGDVGLLRKSVVSAEGAEARISQWIALARTSVPSQYLGIALVQRSGEPPAEIASLWPSLTKLDAPQVACAMAADGVSNRLPLEVPPHTQLRWAASVGLAPASLAAAEARRALEQAADSLAAEVPNGVARLPRR
jgi:hypothetical protein